MGTETIVVVLPDNDKNFHNLDFFHTICLPPAFPKSKAKKKKKKKRHH